jgi:hypothetical protein
MQAQGASNDLVCIKVRDTSWYGPKIISQNVWRGTNGTDFNTCDLQVRRSRSNMFCQRVRDTSYFAAARISTGEWLQQNGSTLSECIRAIGGKKISLTSKATIVEPSVPSSDTSAM